MKVYTLCKYGGQCRFKHYKKHRADKKVEVMYSICTFKDTCNQKLTIYGNKLWSESSWLAEEEHPVVKTDGGELNKSKSARIASVSKIPLSLFGVSEYVALSIMEFGTPRYAFEICLSKLTGESISSSSEYRKHKRIAKWVLQVLYTISEKKVKMNNLESLDFINELEIP